MIPKQEVMALAVELQLQAQVVEKDYALGWFLAGIAAHPGPTGRRDHDIAQCARRHSWTAVGLLLRRVPGPLITRRSDFAASPAFARARQEQPAVNPRPVPRQLLADPRFEETGKAGRGGFR